MKKQILIFLLVLLLPAWAWGADTIIYVDKDNDCSNYDHEAGTCGGGTDECVDTLAEVNTALSSFSSSGNHLYIYFQKGDGWTLTADSQRLQIKKANVTIGTYGSGDKPYIDGNYTYPTSQWNALVEIGLNSSETVSNVVVDGLDIRNTHNGTSTTRQYGMGIWINGLTANGHTAFGPITISNCSIHNHGKAGIQFTGVNNSTLQDSTAVIFEYNDIYLCGEYYRAAGENNGKPQAINSNYSGNTVVGHILRYNKIHDTWTEGAGGGAYMRIEYNEFYNTQGPSILYNGSLSTSTAHRVARYNLFWHDYDSTVVTPPATYDNTAIRVLDESTPSTGITHDFYGNIFVGISEGISLRQIYGYTQQWGAIKIYGNHFVDCVRGFRVSNADYFSSVVLKNNAFIIHSDSEASCVHVYKDNAATWSGWTWGPNFFYGDDNPGSPYYDSNDAEDFAGAGNDPIPKTSGCRTYTSQPVFADDLYPGSSSPLVDAAKADDLGDDYNQYLTTGTVWSTTPASSLWIRTAQDDAGTAWDFGAVIREVTVTYPNGTISTSCPITEDEDVGIELASSASGGSGSGYAYLWDFDGGATNSTEQNPTVTFANPGTYTITLTVTDGAARTDPTPAQCGVTIEESGTPVGGYTLRESFGGADANGQAFGQSNAYLYAIAAKFTSGGVTDLARYSIRLDKYGSPTGTITARIYTDSSGSPGSLVSGSTSAAVDYTSIPAQGSPGFVNFDVGTPFTLSSGTYHLILLPTQTGSDTNYFRLRRDSAGDGIRRGTSDLANWTSAAGYDGIFDLYSYEEGEEPTIPQILEVTTAESDGTYGDDDEIGPFTVIFSEAVDVDTTGGTPYITMELGDNDVNCGYASGTGTASIVFDAFTVAAESDHTTGDLDAKSPLVLNSGTILASDDDEPASLIVPTGSTPGALAYGHDIIISTDVPVVTEIVPVTEDGTYTLSTDSIYFKVRCSKQIIAVGQPNFCRIPIVPDYPSTTYYAYYVSGSGTTDLLMRVTDMLEGTRDTDLDYYGEAPEMELNGGTLKDSSDNDLTLTLPTTGRLADVADIVIAVPTASTGSTIATLIYPVDGDTITGTDTDFDTSDTDGGSGTEIDLTIIDWTLGTGVLGDYYRLTGGEIACTSLTLGTNCTISNLKITGSLTGGKTLLNINGLN